MEDALEGVHEDVCIDPYDRGGFVRDKVALLSAFTAKVMVYRGRRVDLESDHKNGRQNLDA